MMPDRRLGFEDAIDEDNHPRSRGERSPDVTLPRGRKYRSTEERECLRAGEAGAYEGDSPLRVWNIFTRAPLHRRKETSSPGAKSLMT